MAGMPEILSVCESCNALREVSSGLDLSRVNGRSQWNKVYVNVASMAFYGTRLSGASACRVLNTIGSISEADREGNEFPLHIGIHVDHKQDEEVLKAIATAEAKGWKLIVQWNGTATAQVSVTYGLRQPPIYARVSEIERQDGTTERILDWGHYVTDPSGYEEFCSVEAAREYYGLPDEGLTETE